jgi:hypothetical protein
VRQFLPTTEQLRLPRHDLAQAYSSFPCDIRLVDSSLWILKKLRCAKPEIYIPNP